MTNDAMAIWIILAVGAAILVSFVAFGWLLYIFPPKMGPGEAEGLSNRKSGADGQESGGGSKD